MQRVPRPPASRGGSPCSPGSRAARSPREDQRPGGAAGDVTRARAKAAADILRYEQTRAYDDRSVIGGLEAFARRWLADESAAGPPSDSLAARFADALAGYALLPPERRAERVERALSLLEAAQVGARTPPAPLSTPAPRSSTVQRPAAAPGVPEDQEQPPGESRPPLTEARAGGETAARSPLRRHAPIVPPLDTPVEQLHGVGPARARLLQRVGIRRVRDFLDYLPRDHHRYPPPRKARDLLFQRVASFVGTLKELQVTPTSRGARKITATLCDETGCVTAVWFRAGFGDIKARPGEVLAVSGPIAAYGRRVQFEDPDWERADAEPLHTRRWVPVYPLTEGLQQSWLRGWIKASLDAWADSVPDPLPDWLRAEYRLPPLPVALRQVHFPDGPAALEWARRRLAFDELFDIQLLVLQRRARWRGSGGTPLETPEQALAAFTSALPFALTAAQRRVLDEILNDLRQPVPMSRLLQGEVGSGKTVVAAAALLVAVASGAQGAIMAPTEILAEQHFRNLADLYARGAAELEPALGRPIQIALLTGSIRGAERDRVLSGVTDGAIHVLVGTQALIQDKVEFANLGLVVVDEQHRFGVRQRVLLRQKGRNPHMLVMTATPIPRTLALTLYGDLDVSLLDELPPGRQPVRTELLQPYQRESAYQRIRDAVSAGRQAFIICPLVEDSPMLEARAATEEYERLRAGELAGLRLALLHGRMRPHDKERTMRAFRDGEYDVLVSTAVVEVGVDVPNATVMLIEGAERFGLSQLHQFRGRVGRGRHPALCLLLAEQADAEALERLKVLERSTSGLELAERDLELRGPGEFFGVRQSGFPDLRVARLTDADLVQSARRAAERLLQEDPDLARPEHAPLRARVERLMGRGGDAG